MLALKIITTKVTQSCCEFCSFFYGKKNDHSKNQSSLLLKDCVAQRHKEFDSEGQQDPSEFLSFVLKDCIFLSRLTQSEIIPSYKCGKCLNLSDNSVSDERLKNIIHLNITGYFGDICRI